MIAHERLIIAIVVAVFVVLAALVLVAVGCAGATPSAATGALSRETRKRDQSATAGRSSPRHRPPAARSSRRPRSSARPTADRAGRRRRAGRRTCRPTPRRSASPAASSSTAAIVTLMGLSLGRLRRRRSSASSGRSPKGGFGSKIQVGKLDRHPGRDQRRQAASSTSPEGRMWITHYPAERAEKAEKVVPAAGARRHGGRARGRSTRSARTSAAACRPASTSQWFECPCHGSQYNQVGEKKGGPAPRGMDRFAIDRQRRRRSPSTPARSSSGPPIGTNTTGQEAEGPHCVGGGARESDRSPAADQRDHRMGDRRRHRSSASSSYVVDQHPAQRQGRGRLRARAGAEPQALPDDEELEGPKLDRTLGVRARCCCSSSPSACRSTGCSSPAGRPARTTDFDKTFVERGAAMFAHRRRRRLQLRRLPRLPGEGRRRHAPYTLHDSRTAACRSVNWKAPALNTVLLPLLRGRGHATSSPTAGPFSPMPAWGSPAAAR